MKIVILDGYAVNPGDISWAKIEALGEVVNYDRTRPCDVVRRAKDADIILTNKIRLDESNLSRLPNLKFVGLLSTGTDIIDKKYARSKGIIVSNIPAYSTGNVAQTVFAYILSKCSPVKDYDNAVHEGRWVSCADFCFQDYSMSDMAGKTLGIIGYGKIGMKVAQIARAFDMNVAIYSRTRKECISDKEWYDTPEKVAQVSDYLTLHCPLGEDNKGFVNATFISNMKKDAYLINTARGGLINEKDLADALNNGLIAGACVDVLSAEPPKADNPLLGAKNCMITPHIAWASREARLRLIDILENNIKGFMEGRPVNVVN